MLVAEPLTLPIKKDAVSPLPCLMDSGGRKGSAGGSSVVRNMPTIPNWNGTVDFYILDDTITEDVFERVLSEAGKLIGIGQFRPQNGGYAGRFKVKNIKWDTNGDA